MATTTESNLTPGDIRTIIADRPPSGYFFDAWTGDTSSIDDPSSITTTVTMPSSNVTVTATYKQVPIFTTFRANGTNMFNGMLVMTESNPNPMIVNWGDGSDFEAFYNVNKKKGGYPYFLSHDYTGIVGDCDITISLPLTSCIYMDFYRNSITTPPDLTGLINLVTLDLTNTLITTPPDLTGLTSLLYLYLEDTLITTPPILTGLTSLLNLDMSGASIITPPDLTGLTNLTYLDLSYTLNENPPVLTGLTSLYNLYLNNTPITTLPVLTGLTNLVGLDLSYSQITTTLDLTDLTSLQSLNLQYSQSTTSPILTGLISLQSLYLQYSQITTPPDLTGLVSLGYLDLSNTSLDTTDVDTVLGYFSILYPNCGGVNLQNTAIPTPEVLQAAVTANPQCSFYVDA